MPANDDVSPPIKGHEHIGVLILAGLASTTAVAYGFWVVGVWFDWSLRGLAIAWPMLSAPGAFITLRGIGAWQEQSRKWWLIATISLSGYLLCLIYLTTRGHPREPLALILIISQPGLMMFYVAYGLLHRHAWAWWNAMLVSAIGAAVGVSTGLVLSPLVGGPILATSLAAGAYLVRLAQRGEYIEGDPASAVIVAVTVFVIVGFYLTIVMILIKSDTSTLQPGP